MGQWNEDNLVAVINEDYCNTCGEECFPYEPHECANLVNNLKNQVKELTAVLSDLIKCCEECEFEAGEYYDEKLNNAKNVLNELNS